MNITIPSLLDKRLWIQDEVCVYGRFPKDDAPDIPSIDEIIAGIRMYTDFNIERNLCTWQFSYKPYHGAEPFLYKTELNRDEVVQRGGLTYVDNMIDACKRHLAEYVQSVMKKEKIEEEEKMTNFKEEQVLNIMRKYNLNIELWPRNTHDRVKEVHICIQGRPSWPIPWTAEEKTIVHSYYCGKYGMVKFIEPDPPCAIPRSCCTPFTQRGMDIPKVMKVETYNDRVVKVTFADGSFTKAVCGEQDTFDLDTGITVCLMKKMLGENGTRKYNDALRDIHKLMEKRENDKIEAELKKEEARKKTHKADMKRKAKKLKAKEEAIDIQKQGIIRALQEMGIGNDGK